MARPVNNPYKSQYTDGFPVNLGEYISNEAKLGYDFMPPVYCLGGNQWCLLFKRKELGKPQKPNKQNQRLN